MAETNCHYCNEEMYCSQLSDHLKYCKKRLETDT